MEVTKQVGDPEPSDPQGHPSASSQPLGGGLREPQGPWRHLGSRSFRQGLASSLMALADGARGPASQARGPEPARQPPEGPAQGRAQCGLEQPPRGAPRLSSTGLRPGPGLEAEAHLVLEKQTPSPPRCPHRGSPDGPARLRSWPQVQGAREGKAPAKVLVGCGVATSQQVPCFLSGEIGSAAAPCPLPAPAQDQGQGKGWCPARATPARAAPPAPKGTLPPAAGARHPCNHGALLGSFTADLLRKSGGPLSGLWEPSNVVTFCQDQATGAQGLPTPGHHPAEAPDHAPELEAAPGPAFLPQPEPPAETPLFYTFDLDSLAPAPGRPGPPTPQRSRQEVSHQPLRASNSACCQRPAPPAPGAPACQLQDPAGGHVLVCDLDVGTIRMGLLCQDALGSLAVLVGPVPNRPSVYDAPNTQPAVPSAVPAVRPHGHRSGVLGPVPAVLPSPVPSSMSSGSFREVALLPKEAKLHLAPPGAIRGGLRPEPTPGGAPLQVGERTLSRDGQDAGWSNPAAEKRESAHTIWVLDEARMQDASVGRAGRLQVTSSEPAPEPAPPAPAREAARAGLQVDAGSHPWKDAGPAHPNDPRAEGPRQGPLGRWPPLAEQHLLSGPPPLTGTPLARQLSLSGQPSFCQEPAVSEEPILSRGAPSTGEAGQAPTPCPEGEALGLPTHVGILRVPLAQEKTRVYVNRETMGLGVPPSVSSHRPAPWQPAGSHLVTFTTPGAGYRVVPMATAGTAPQDPRLKLTAEDIPNVPVVTGLGLLSGACCALPGQPPGLCGHAPGHGQSSAAVVIDTGSGFTKCGLAGEDHVLSVVPSRVQLLRPSGPGRPRYAVLGGGGGGGAYTVLHRGVVSDWDALEVLWQHLFYCKLGMRPEELAVLVADSPVSPRTNREKVAEILFECFHVPAMQAVQQGLLALYAYGRTTGLVLGSGHGTSYVAPILTGDPAPLDTYRLDVAGADLSGYLAELLLAGGHAPPGEEGVISRVKEACCYVALDAKAEAARSGLDFVLPDKRVITLGSERFGCPEALFQPHLLGLRQPGLPQLALLSISRLEARQQEQLLANVVLDGGSTLLRGFPERLRQELGPRATVLGSPHRAVAAWLGGSIMASRDSFRSLWLRRREYEEEGSWAVYRYHL